MFHKLFCPLLLCLFCSVCGVEAQPSTLAPARKKAVYGTDYYVSPSVYDYTAAARAIVGDAATDYEQAERLYLWLCAHVTYDLTGRVRTADGCWTHRTAVCQGYCELFYRMAESIGLRSRLVFGRCKHAGVHAKLEDHTWLSVETEKGEILLDPTWGAGAYLHGEFVRLRDPLLWFDVEPAWFVFTHQPKSRKRQHLDTEVSDEQFAALPYVTPFTSVIGLSGADALTRMLAGGDAPPHVMMAHADELRSLTIVNIPTTLHLAVDSTYTFVVSNPSSSVMLTLVNESESVNQSHWTADGTTYTLNLTPRHRGRLSLALMPSVGVPTLRRLVVYEVE